MRDIRTHEASQFASVQGLQCTALLATSAEPTTAAVFVHGFLGSTEGTWGDIANLIHGDSDWAAVDLYFVGYDSANERVGLTAERLTSLVELIFPVPPDEVSKKADPLNGGDVRLRPLVPNYSRLILVGHSQGGVVIRKAVSERARGIERTSAEANVHPICSAHVRLFAPALFGVEFTGLPGLVEAIGVLRTVARTRWRSSPALRDLTPGSHLLTSLAEKTLEAADSRGDLMGLRANIVWASKDDFVVGFDRYDCDPPYRVADDQTHVTLCKPSSSYRAPMQFVLTAEWMGHG